MQKEKTLWQKYRSIPLVYRIAVSFILGSIMGLIFGEAMVSIKFLGDIFIKLLKMIVIPIIFFTLIMGMKKLSPSRLGRIGIQTVLFYSLTTAIAILIGLFMANLIDPGIGLTLKTSAEISAEKAPGFQHVIMNIFPDNVVGAMAEGNVLQTIFFAIIFGIALAIVKESGKAKIKKIAELLFDLVETISEVMFKIVWGIMEYGVLGIFALMAGVFGESGLNVIIPFAKLIFSLLLAVIVHISITYLLIIVIGFLRKSPLSFLNGSKNTMLTALSIRSSSGTLPVTMNDAENNLKIDESVYSFTLPLGATINMDGTAMYQGVAAIFAANLIGQALTIGEQMTIVLTATLASIGTAGVPGSGLIMLTMVLTQLGLPLEVVGFVAGIDPILDRIRTMNNVTGDLAVTSLVAKLNDAIDLDSGTWI
ncbi:MULTISPECIES: dicarboxylate/amino acid:cation symporter [unclassified Halanaerobium]|uniref:dicarboxylate/amino acid:cation symporter n=1 Tax=unclassified Halanaerobium TaxID=2641197 RepID=UPI000DF42976|nr:MULTISPECIES: dicarboxylate/amino acid:cation symporter [unclassified Halanaerobium]RCW46621.1 Na+/H+-dicarboxylate symporter [Halanaerobium sp. MA284_MarDTE_T2]RCW83469.1 Na+/H+-dicarboxylate symporter [Halanaerobium sp. DL-01]